MKTAERLFTDQELEALARSGAERVAAALGTGDPAQAQGVFEQVLKSYRGFHELYRGWTASIFAFLNERYGHAVVKELTGLEDVLANSARIGMSLAAIRTLQEGPEKVFAAKLAARDLDGARRFFAEVETGARDLHDFYRDYVSTLLSNVYRRYGVDVLAECLRASSEKDWMPWMLTEVDTPPRERLIAWAELLGVGNFATIRIEEQADRFVMIQDPCGSCGRQHLGGRYDPPWNLATIVEPHATTYGTGGCTAYRAHIPMMHYVMPLERIGAPWPLIQCPRSKEGQCKVTLFKDTRQPVAPAEAGWSR